MPVPVTGRSRTAPSSRRVLLGGLAVALVLAGGVSYYASASPDGLEKVAADHGMDTRAKEHAADGSPLADYGIGAIANARLSGGLAGVIGVGATAAVGAAVLYPVVRRRRHRPGPVRTRVRSRERVRSDRDRGNNRGSGSRVRSRRAARRTRLPEQGA
ncbi:hypothetical protein SSCG_01254 [Streptomyces clavuligerus]|nr:hypothetical protein SSCG_01254 [Streptomyces clavuligerus]